MATHIAPREQALERENANLIQALRIQAVTVETLTTKLNEERSKCDGVTAELVYLRTHQYKDTLGKLAVAKASAEMWKRKAEQVERDSLKMAQETDETIAGLKADAARLDWLESSTECHGFFHTGYGEYRYYAHQVKDMPTVREAIDNAMKESKS